MSLTSNISMWSIMFKMIKTFRLESSLRSRSLYLLEDMYVLTQLLEVWHRFGSLNIIHIDVISNEFRWSRDSWYRLRNPVEWFKWIRWFTCRNKLIDLRLGALNILIIELKVLTAYNVIHTDLLWGLMSTLDDAPNISNFSKPNVCLFVYL